MKRIVNGLIRETKKELRYLITNPKPILFDHLPKCGGTTINWYLESVFPRRFVYEISGENPLEAVEKFKDLPKGIRLKSKVIYGHLANELIDYANPESLVVTVLRDPVSRIVSHYHYVKANKNHYLHHKIKEGKIRLDNYCYQNLSSELENWYVSHFSKMSISQINRDPDKAIKLALKNIKDKYHIIGFQDDITSFVNELAHLANLKNKFQNQILNGRKKKSKSKELDQATYDLICEKNSLDIELYNQLIFLRESKKSKVVIFKGV
ncbi:sulfotransferase family 2 domain-containing protein [Algoriphagus sp.]|uniref:sulfotransferase family 2 domain-containing protein n=1 Tax=Algoriphagus sp. TaxID=1872435 RepID=UPI0025F9B93A|nr:sulfotransferase family 2 domain-containing protein [Algoriphagus sp.]